MKERDCTNCKHHAEDGCSSWDCEYKPKDLISRADAIEALSRSSIYAWSTEQDLVAHSWAIRILQSLPSADAVQGEWQKVEEQPYFRKHYDTVCCSVCRKKGNRKWNYCPNCGARMKGGDDE